MYVDETSRRFEIIAFVDYYGEECSVQQSSAALDIDHPGAGALWIGRDSGRAHLTRAQVAELLPHLQAYVETGAEGFGER